MARKPVPQPVPEPAEEPAPSPQAPRRTTIACAGCGGAFVIALVTAIIVLNAWDAKDGRLFNGKPLPKNVAYIGRWTTDGDLSARVDTFAIAGDRIACDFTIRNDTKHDVTVRAIGRTIVAPGVDARMGQGAIELNLMPGDQPMRVTGDQDVLGLQTQGEGQWLMAEPDNAAQVEAPKPYTLKPHQTKQVRFRPKAYQELGNGQVLSLMPAKALRIAVLLDDGKDPHAFYLLRKSAGIGGWFERGVEKAVTTRRQ
jgi:hypothetical protein